MNPVKTVVIATLMTGLAAPVLAGHHGRHATSQDAVEAATQEEQKLRNRHDEAAGKQSRRTKAAGKKEQEQLEEHREEADKKTAKARKQAEDTVSGADGQGRPDTPPGLAQKDEPPSAGHDFKQEQESRTKQEKKWWRLWK